MPAVLGTRFLPALIISFFITDLIIGFHGVTLFTWGSVILIGFTSKFFKTNITRRFSGALIGACIFYVITNFGVWSLGFYGYSLEGLITCYILAIPFFGNSLIGTLIFSSAIEFIIKRNLLFKKIFN